MKKIWLVVMFLLAVTPLAAQEAAQDEEYRVRFTDTLDVIGQEFDVSVACLAQANNLTNANQLEFAQTLAIPADCDPYDPIESDIIANIEDLTEFFGEDTDDGQGGGGATPGDYRVRYGDTIDVIAQEFDVSVACLVAANDLVNANNLSFGQMLVIPDNCDPYDEIESIILSNIDDLEAAGFTETDLGQGGGAARGGDEDEAGDEPLAMGDVATVPDETYVVEANDNLTQIAEAFGVTLACLQRTNGIINPDLIYPGQELLISGSCQAGGGDVEGGVIANRQCQFDRNAGRTVRDGVYVVQAGDTLDFIGCDLNMNTLCLAEINNLQNRGRLAIGQRLTISSQCSGWVAP